jgi:hypothetical protein
MSPSEHDWVAYRLIGRASQQIAKAPLDARGDA